MAQKEKYTVCWTDICGNEHIETVWAWSKTDAWRDIDPSMESVQSCVPYEEDDEEDVKENNTGYYGSEPPGYTWGANFG